MTVSPHVGVSDSREPVFVFSLPFGDDANPTVVYGLFGVSVAYWMEVLLLIFLDMVLAAVTGVILYKGIIESKNYVTTSARILCFGVLLPFWITWPTTVYDLLNVQNLIFKFIVGALIPSIMIFRISEVVFACCPDHATGSMSNFVLYFASPMVFARDPTTGNCIKACTSRKLCHFKNFVLLLLISGCLQSILTPCPELNLFGDNIGGDDWLRWRRMKTWQLYANSFLHAVLFQLYLTTYCEGLISLYVIATGYQMDPVMKNPLGGATSPSDFWGKRWNLVIHGVLKGGVYKPARKNGFSPLMAMTATFLASGLFHEWIAHGLFRTSCIESKPRSTLCYEHLYGGSMVFFSWQAILLMGEQVVLGRNVTIVSNWAAKLPLPVRTAMIVALGIPFAHFFTEPYVCSNYFRHGQMGLPMILPIAK